MNPQRRGRAAAGLTLLFLSGLGLLAWTQSRSPDARLPVIFPYTPPPMPTGTEVVRLFDAPESDTAITAERAAAVEPEAAVYALYIPELELYAPIIPIYNEVQLVDGQEVWQLSLPPAHAVGWSALSAPVGAAGNTVLVGHNNEFGEVFRDLETLQVGDELFVRAEDGDRRYEVSETALFEEEFAPLAERLKHARWIAPTPDQRLTLITCWPYFSNTHRVVVVAKPSTRLGG